jgi:hypothetical protein
MVFPTNVVITCILLTCVLFHLQILKRTNNIFELVSHKSLVIGGSNEIGDTDSEDSSRKIHLKGELIIRNWHLEILSLKSKITKF